MEFLTKQAPLFTFGILVFAFFAYLETRMGSLKMELKEDIQSVRVELKEDIRELSTRIGNLETRMDSLGSKMDSLIIMLSRDRKPAGQ